MGFSPVSFLFTLLFLCGVYSQNTFLPVALRDGLVQYVTFGPRLLVLQLPQVSVITDRVYGKVISYPPISKTGNTLFLSNNAGGSFRIDTTTYALTESGAAPPSGSPISGALLPLNSVQCVSDGAGATYCFNAGSPATVTKTVGGVVTTISLGVRLTFSQFIKLDLAAGLLYITGAESVGRGSTDFKYYIFSLAPFSIRNGPVTLINTALSGCPVAPRGCGVPVLLYIDANNGVLSYIFTKSVEHPGAPLTFQATLESYSFTCGFANATIDDSIPNSSPSIFSGSCGTGPRLCNGAGVCGATDGCCQDFRTGNRCYNKGLATCNLDEDGRTVLCGINDGACNGVCYDKRHYICDGGALKFIG